MHRQAGNTGIPIWLVAGALAGATSALAGGFWDDAWHTERGRDTFLIAPHIAIYAGVAAIGAALGIWVLQVARRDGIAAVLGHRIMLLAATGVAVTLASAPIDGAWHEAFGRDAVSWSPPHMLGMVGLLGLGAALLATLSDRRVLGPVAGALVIAAATFPVFEYDTDVPQFDAMWYLPVLALGAAIAVALVHLTSRRPWAAGAAAVTHLAFLGGVSVFLLAADFPPPALPLLVLPAFAVDVARQRGWGLPARTALFVGVLYGIYVPVRNFLGDGVSIDAVDIALGVPLALLAVGAVFAAAGGTGRPSRVPGPALAALGSSLLVVLIAAPAALAHDPGQGDPAGAMRLEVSARDDAAQVRGAWLAPDCRRQPQDGEVVARRGGRERQGRLRLRGCSFTGSVALPSRGRWFVYVNLHSDGRRVESWLPVENTAEGERVADAARYAYEPQAPGSSALFKYAGGFLLYATMAAILAATIVLLRRQAAAGAPF